MVTSDHVEVGFVDLDDFRVGRISWIRLLRLELFFIVHDLGVVYVL